jgi:hypothetical protein
MPVNDKSRLNKISACHHIKHMKTTGMKYAIRLQIFQGIDNNLVLYFASIAE